MFRVAGMYFVVSWLLLQSAVIFEGSLNLPSWFDSFVTVLVLLGFPVAMVLAWAFEMTPEGVRPTEQVDPKDSIHKQTGQRLDIILAILLLVFGAIVLGDRFFPKADDAETGGLAVIAADEIQSDLSDPRGGTPSTEIGNSIAVLPFADLSQEGDQGYFSDGIAEELLNVLSQIPALEVAGRTSSFAFKGKPISLREIGDILRVKNVLEGSVRKAGDKIRVSAKLVDVSTGYQRWSSTYNADLVDIFAVQDKISQEIVEELTPHLSADFQDTAIRSARGNLQAYDLYLLSKQHARGGTFEDYKNAANALDKALALDPDYVPALVWRGYYEIVLSDAPGFQGVSGVPGVIPIEEASRSALDYINAALKIEPRSADALFARATVYSTRAENSNKAERDYREAIRLKPNFSLAKNDLAVLLETDLKFEEAFALLEEALSHDPGLVDANFNLFQGYYWRSHFQDAQRVLDSWARISPDDETRKLLQAQFAFDTGELAKAVQAGQTLNAASPDRPQVIRFLATSWLNLGAYAKVLLSSYDQHHALALSGIGETAEGRILVEKNLARRPDDVDQQQVYMDFLFFHADWPALTQYYEDTYGSVQAVKDSDAYPPFEKISAALLATGHKDAKSMMTETRSHIDAQRAQSISLSVLDQEEAILLILEGKPEDAMKRLTDAFDKGSFDIYIRQNPIYSRLADRADYQSLCARTLAVINAERAKLGLQPTILAGEP